jgi:hypothetical protein
VYLFVLWTALFKCNNFLSVASYNNYNKQKKAVTTRLNSKKPSASIKDIQNSHITAVTKKNL